MRATTGWGGRRRAARYVVTFLLAAVSPRAPAQAASLRAARAAPDVPRVGEVHGQLSSDHRSEVYPLLPLAAAETLDVRLETHLPQAFVVTVEAQGGEVLAKAAPSADGRALRLAWRLPTALPEGHLRVAAAPGAEPVAFRLVVALDHPEILRGGPAPSGKPIMVITQVVQIGIKLQQIVGIDQKAENFDAVATLRMDWSDPALTYDPVACRCRFQVMTLEEFEAFVANRDHRWPAFTILNQQGNRWTQGRYVALWPDGRATYFEQMSTKFQAPDFNFKRFPFDRQTFAIEIEPLLPSRFYRFVDLPDFTAVGHKLGEEEWEVIGHRTRIADAQSGQFVRSHFRFEYYAKRHLASYWFRILVPLLLIIGVTWLTFFLKDFTKRIEATSANLLLFVAYYLAVGSDLPRLGYVTFLDALFLITFILSVAAVAYNVQLGRLKARGETRLAERLDRPMLLAYPVVYIVVWLGTAWTLLR